MIIIEDLGICERRYSDNNVKIKQIETNTLWNDAIDIKPCAFTYEETNEQIDQEIVDESDYAQAGRILLGINE